MVLGREIDKFCVQLSTPEHERLYGFNQSLARRYWRRQEWNTELMRRLKAWEAELQAREGTRAKISRAAILDIMEDMRAQFGIADLPLVEYHAADVLLGDVGGGDVQ